MSPMDTSAPSLSLAPLLSPLLPPLLLLSSVTLIVRERARDHGRSASAEKMMEYRSESPLLLALGFLPLLVLSVVLSAGGAKKLFEVKLFKHVRLE
jgi:hypothetical protein